MDMENAQLPPWFEENEDGAILSVSDEHRETILFVFNRYLEGQGVAVITSELNRKHLPPWKGERQWEPRQVRSLLSDERLLGEEGDYPAAIEPDLFSEVQERLGGNRAGEGKFSQVTEKIGSCLAPKHTQL